MKIVGLSQVFKIILMKLISTEECIMSKLNLNVIDKVTRQNVAARVQILDSQGEFLSPENSILKIGPGLPFFYSDGICSFFLLMIKIIII